MIDSFKFLLQLILLTDLRKFNWLRFEEISLLFCVARCMVGGCQGINLRYLVIDLVISNHNLSFLDISKFQTKLLFSFVININLNCQKDYIQIDINDCKKMGYIFYSLVIYIMSKLASTQQLKGVQKAYIFR